MPDIGGKIVLITGAAGAVGCAVVDGGDCGRRHGHRQRSQGRQRHRCRARRHQRGRLAARRWRHRTPARPARRAGQCRRHRRARQCRDSSTSPPGGACSRSISTARSSAANTRCRCCAKKAARSSTCRRSRAWSAGTISPPTMPRRAGVSLLSKSVALYGARLQAAGALQRRVPGLSGRADGRLHRARRRAIRETARQKMAQRYSAWQRLGQPAEVAALCVYLLSDEAGFITGADLPIDGGLTARRSGVSRASARMTCAAAERDRPCRS